MDTLKEYWAIIVAAIAGIAWLIRLESRSLSNEAEIKRLWEQRKDDNAEAKASRNEVLQEIREVRTDIKKLLERDHR